MSTEFNLEDRLSRIERILAAEIEQEKTKEALSGNLPQWAYSQDFAMARLRVDADHLRARVDAMQAALKMIAIQIPAEYLNTEWASTIRREINRIY